MRGRKRQRKKAQTLFVGQPRRRERDIAKMREAWLGLHRGPYPPYPPYPYVIGRDLVEMAMDRAIAEIDAAVRDALRSGFTFDPRPEQIPPHFTIWGQR